MGLVTGDTIGLAVLVVVGLRKLDVGVLAGLLSDCAPFFSKDAITGRKGGGALKTGRYDSAYHSYQILDLPVTLHMETCSSELLGRYSGSYSRLFSRSLLRTMTLPERGKITETNSACPERSGPCYRDVC